MDATEIVKEFKILKEVESIYSEELRHKNWKDVDRFMQLVQQNINSLFEKLEEHNGKK